MHRRHLDVPADLAQSIWPELTKIHRPIAEMSRNAVEILLGQIKSRRGPILRGGTGLDITLIRQVRTRRRAR